MLVSKHVGLRLKPKLQTAKPPIQDLFCKHRELTVISLAGLSVPINTNIKRVSVLDQNRKELQSPQV